MDHERSTMVSRVEANFAAFHRHLGSTNLGTVVDTPSLLCIFAGVPIGTYNGVFRSQLPPSETGQAIDTVLKWAQGRDHPIVWWVTPSSSPECLPQLLEGRGFHRYGELIGMAADLERVHPSAPPSIDVSVEPIRDARLLETWVRAYALIQNGGQDLPEQYLGPLLQLERELGWTPDAAYQRYLARVDDRPVGTSVSYCDGDVVGVHFVATVPALRRRGIGTALTLAALRAGSKAGYRMAVLHSSSAGLSLYRGLGFEECCRLTTYVWIPASLEA